MGKPMWTCSYAYNCAHHWRWTAVLCKKRKRLARRLAFA